MSKTAQSLAFLDETLERPFKIAFLLLVSRHDRPSVRFPDGEANREQFFDRDPPVEFGIVREIGQAEPAMPQETQDRVLAQAETVGQRVFVFERHGVRWAR